MNKKNQALQVILAFLFSALLTSSAFAVDSLHSYLLKAQNNDPDYLGARASYEAEFENRALGRAGLFPTISYSVGTTRVVQSRRDLGVTATRDFLYDTRSNTLSFRQPLFDVERWASYKEGDARAEHAEIAFADAHQNLILRVAQAYFDYLLADHTVDLAKAQSATLAAQRTQAENLYKSGVATVTDVAETQARQSIAKAQEFSAASALDLRRRELGKLIGEMPRAPMSAIPSVGAGDTPLPAAFNVPPPSIAIARPVITPELIPPQPNTLEPWMEQAKAANLRVLALRLLVTISGYQLDRATASDYPTVSLVASRQQSKEPSYFGASEDTSQIGVQLQMNLFSGGSASAQKRQAESQREKVRQDLESAIRDAEIKTSQAFLEIVNGIATIRALEQAVKSAALAVEGNQAGQRAGLKTNSDVLNSQQQWFSVRRDLQRERFSYLVNRLKLQAMVGNVSEADVIALDRLANATSP